MVENSIYSSFIGLRKIVWNHDTPYIALEARIIEKMDETHVKVYYDYKLEQFIIPFKLSNRLIKSVILELDPDINTGNFETLRNILRSHPKMRKVEVLKRYSPTNQGKRIKFELDNMLRFLEKKGWVIQDEWYITYTEVPSLPPVSPALSPEKIAVLETEADEVLNAELEEDKP